MRKGLLLTLLLLAVAAVGWWLWQKQDKAESQTPDTSGWQLFHDDQLGFSYRYPHEFTPDYISVQEWPPTIAVSEADFACAGEEFIQQINGHRYCVERQSEGAAGSIYTSSVYTTEQAGKLVTVSLTVREVQCGNYGEPQKTACEEEREDFDLDGLIDNIVRTVTIDP